MEVLDAFGARNGHDVLALCKQPCQRDLTRAAILGLGEAADWLTRIRSDMIGVVVGRRAVRWALLSGTPIEAQMLGPMTRGGDDGGAR